VAENLAFWAGAFAASDIAPALDAFDLHELAQRRAGEMSAGQKRRLSLARLLVTGRPLWCLDEPTVSSTWTTSPASPTRSKPMWQRAARRSSPPISTSACRTPAARRHPLHGQPPERPMIPSAATLRRGGRAMIGLAETRPRAGGPGGRRLRPRPRLLPDRRHAGALRRRAPRRNPRNRIAPGILWIGALLACLLSLDRIFQLDWEDGSRSTFSPPRPCRWRASRVKALAHWITTGPAAGAGRPGPGRAPEPAAPGHPWLFASLALGTPALSGHRHLRRGAHRGVETRRPAAVAPRAAALCAHAHLRRRSRDPRRGGQDATTPLADAGRDHAFWHAVAAPALRRRRRLRINLR
jgi:hypothetical protein